MDSMEDLITVDVLDDIIINGSLNTIKKNREATK